MIALKCSNRGFAFGFPTSAESNANRPLPFVISRCYENQQLGVYSLLKLQYKSYKKRQESPVREDYHQFPRVSIYLSRTHWPDTAAALLCYTTCMEMETGSQPNRFLSTNGENEGRERKKIWQVCLFVAFRVGEYLIYSIGRYSLFVSLTYIFDPY